MLALSSISTKVQLLKSPSPPPALAMYRICNYLTLDHLDIWALTSLNDLIRLDISLVSILLCI